MRLREQAKTESPDPAYKMSNSLEDLMKIAFTRKLAMEMIKRAKSEVGGNRGEKNKIEPVKPKVE